MRPLGFDLGTRGWDMGGFRGPAWWITLKHQRMRPLGFDLGTRDWDMGWV